jgi:hypothetical protein
MDAQRNGQRHGSYFSFVPRPGAKAPDEMLG